MIFRATAKLLKTSGIKPVKSESTHGQKLSGEWYCSLVSQLRPGKLAVQFLHYPSFVTIVIPGKSLNKTIPQLPGRVSSLLKRNGYEILIPKFELDSPTEIYTTNNRGLVSHLNQIRFNLEYHFSKANTIEDINYEEIEDIQLEYLFGGKVFGNDYLTPKEILNIEKKDSKNLN